MIRVAIPVIVAGVGAGCFTVFALYVVVDSVLPTKGPIIAALAVMVSVAAFRRRSRCASPIRSDHTSRS